MRLFVISLKIIYLFHALTSIESKRENKQRNIIIKWMFQGHNFPLLFAAKIDNNIDADYKVSRFLFK